jgi:KDO2-lipid IV(A) lauroyltransferase
MATDQPRPAGLLRRAIGDSLYALGNLHRRMLVVYFGVLGPRVAYAVTGFLARRLYRLLEPVRLRSEAQCRAALGGLRGSAGRALTGRQVSEIAEAAFVHRVWNLTDLHLADRLLHANTFQRYGGAVPPDALARMRSAQRRGQAAIFLTGYYGPFDLLPVFLGFNGLHCGAVYLPHRNADFDAWRRRIRGRSGIEMIPVQQATGRLAAILGSGGTVAIVADHHAGSRGMPATFLGLPTRVIRSVGLLAWRYNADVIVAGIRREGRAFHFRILIEDIIPHGDWAAEGDAVEYITDRYLRGLERMIREDPTQYLWAYARWGNELAEQLVRQSETSCDAAGRGG